LKPIDSRECKMASDFVLYGSTGYVGRAAAELAVEQGLRPLLVGRNSETVSQQATELGLEYRTVALDEPDALDAILEDAPVVLNLAGPYLYTHRPIVEACLRSGTHYLDITGEPPVLDSIIGLDAEARERGVMLLPSVGFDVVPTDCLAALSSDACRERPSFHLCSRVMGPQDSHREPSTR
jgi:short subunit dehydrogenase-like uncharacterized protein